MSQHYDVLVIGGGHNGLCAALELAHSGLSVLVMEAQKDVGGCATTHQPLLPGFLHSPHANTFIFVDIMPDVLHPDALGMQLVQPEAQLGVAFADGRPPVILHRPDLLASTRKSFANYSRKDAATYVALKLCSERLGNLIQRGLYAPPDSRWFAEQVHAVQKAFKRHIDVNSLGRSSARALIDQLFESGEVRVLLYHLATETGLSLNEIGSDLAFLGYSLWIAGRWRIPVGGMGSYANALGEAATAAGAVIARSTPAARIRVAENRALGVETVSGQFIRAEKAVLAAVPLMVAFDELIDVSYITPSERSGLADFQKQQPASIATSFFCLAEAPHYKSALHDPEIDRCLKTVIGHESPADVLAHAADVRRGLLPRPAGVVRMHSLWDSTQAPPGLHVAAVDSSFPALNAFDGDTIRMVETAFPQAFLDMWGGSRADAVPAPLAMSADLSALFERRMLLQMGEAQYRTSISGLYLGGPGIYPGGGVHGACGRNAAYVICGDVRKKM